MWWSFRMLFCILGRQFISGEVTKMARELAFVFINPYTIAKSRTGGVIGRYLNRTDLDLVAVRMFGPSPELVQRYAEHLRGSDTENKLTCELLASYVLKNYGPDASGKRRRVMLLLFEGENAVEKIWKVTGSATLRWGSGETVRDTFGDYIVDDQNKVTYFEPAVLAGPSPERVGATLRMWAEYSARDGGIVMGAGDVPVGDDAQKTLVLLKPDSFRNHSSRAGSMMDILSTSGLRIIAAKKFSMTVAQAEEFYAPVRETLKEKLKASTSTRAAEVLSRELGVQIPDAMRTAIGDYMGPLVAEREFENIVQYMSGHRPSQCSPTEKNRLCGEECLALVYCGTNAVTKIRTILGATDPAKAIHGSVRREFGSSILVNSAHASDSPESVRRELEIVNVEQDTIVPWVEAYYGNLFLQIKALGGQEPDIRSAVREKITGLWKKVAL